MSLTRRLALAAMALFAASSASAKGGGNKVQGNKPQPYGRFAVQGRNPEGSAYSGSAELREAVGGQISVTWTVGGQTYQGIGPREGRIVTIEWGDPHPVVYVLMADGELHGTWADGTALDKLIPS